MAEPILQIQDLTVRTGGRRILHGINLSVAAGETVALFGPNGSGKTTLLYAVFGFPGAEIEDGRILFKGRDVTTLATDERARMGMGMAFQRPPSVRGVRLGDMVRASLRMRGAETDEAEGMLESLNLQELIGRDLNLGFSGGEIKRSELVQLQAQKPDFVMFDEPDSGVDLVSVSAVGRVMRLLLDKDVPEAERFRGGLVITHGGHILDHIDADRAYVLLEGELRCAGDPRSILDDIRAHGYKGCVRCGEEA